MRLAQEAQAVFALELLQSIDFSFISLCLGVKKALSPRLGSLGLEAKSGWGTENEIAGCTIDGCRAHWALFPCVRERDFSHGTKVAGRQEVGIGEISCHNTSKKSLSPPPSSPSSLALGFYTGTHSRIPGQQSESTELAGSGYCTG